MLESIFYAQVNIACILLVGVLFFNIRRLPTAQLKDTLLADVLFWHMLYFASDAVWALVTSGYFPKNTFTILAVNYSNAIILSIVAYKCFLYSSVGSNPDLTKKQLQHQQRILRIPIILQAICFTIGFIADPKFWVTDLQINSIYFAFFVPIPLIYICTAAILGIYHGYKSQSRQHLKTYILIASYAPVMILSGLLQLTLITAPIFCFWCTFILLFAYTHSQSLLVSTDALTMLNNRNQLKRYLYSPKNAKASYVYMIDINDFKSINDLYGHHEGDRALVLVASALKRVCGRAECPIFLCRYGGDEFLFIARTNEPGKISDLIHSELSESSSQIQKHKKMPYTIQASVGYVSWDGDVSHFKDSLKLADNKMYEQKKTNQTKIKSA